MVNHKTKTTYRMKSVATITLFILCVSKHIPLKLLLLILFLFFLFGISYFVNISRFVYFCRFDEFLISNMLNADADVYENQMIMNRTIFKLLKAFYNVCNGFCILFVSHISFLLHVA